MDLPKDWKALPVNSMKKSSRQMVPDGMGVLFNLKFTVGEWMDPSLLSPHDGTSLELHLPPTRCIPYHELSTELSTGVAAVTCILQAY